MKKLVIQTSNAPAAIGPYSQAVMAGGFIFVSGQIPINPDTGDVVSISIEAETHRVMKNIAAVLDAAHCGFKNVVKTTIFLKRMDDFQKVNEIYASYFDGNFPARETVAAAGLPKNVNVEISVIAMA